MIRQTKTFILAICFCCIFLYSFALAQKSDVGDTNVSAVPEGVSLSAGEIIPNPNAVSIPKNYKPKDNWQAPDPDPDVEFASFNKRYSEWKNEALLMPNQVKPLMIAFYYTNGKWSNNNLEANANVPETYHNGNIKSMTILPEEQIKVVFNMPVTPERYITFINTIDHATKNISWHCFKTNLPIDWTD